MRWKIWFFALCVLARGASGAGEWNAGMRDSAGGFYLSSPDQAFHLSWQGYTQFQGNFYPGDYRATTERPEGMFGMQIRRARMDLVATVFRQWELLTEVGTPTVRVPGAVTGADVGIVETRITTPIFGDFMQLRIGKFVVPFSAENARSSRRLTTIERSALLNSLIASSFLDTQIGFMLYGRVAEGIFNYYLGVFNGTGNALTTGLDDNESKEIQVKVVFNPAMGFSFGLAWNTHDDSTTTLSLLDHAFVPFVSGQVAGRRHGFEVDLDVTSRVFSFRMELLGVSYGSTAAALTNRIRQLWGAYLQMGIMATGDDTDGFEIVFRYEFSRITSALGTGDLQSGLLGFNWYVNPNLTWQTNVLFEAPSRVGTSAPYATSGVKYMALNQMQLKF